MSYYTINRVVNPAFQLGIAGYYALLDARIALDTSNILYGGQSLFVQCPGSVPGEGVSAAGGLYPGSTIGSASLYLSGNGNVTVTAVISPGNNVVASAPVMVSSEWKRVSFDGITVSPGETLNLLVGTTVAQECSFWVSGVQVEDTSPAHPYCDGDQPGCIWIDGYWGGESAQLYQNPATAYSYSHTNSNVVVISYGDVSEAVPRTSFSHTYSPVVYLSAPGPVGAVTDFSVSLLTDDDPALAYASWNNGGALATSSGYSRPWGVFSPPRDYQVSGGEYLYHGAAYFAQGLWFPSASSSASITVTNAQAEILPLTTGLSSPSPSAFGTPRSVHSLIVADRANYCSNPSFEVSTANWSALGSSALSQDGSMSVGQIGEYDDAQVNTGTHSLKVQVNASGDGASTTISDLLTGRNYAASAYVQSGAGLGNISLSISGGITSIVSTGGTGYGTGAYGEGYYGGFNPGADLPIDIWYRIFTLFTATADSHDLEIYSTAASDVSYPAYFWVDAVLVEPGEILGEYFDGSFGGNYTWDSVAGSSGLAKSYYYDQRPLKQQAVTNILNRHTPQGISYISPVYSVPQIL